MKNDDLHETPAEVVPSEGHDPLKYGIGHMELVYEARERSRRFRAARKALKRPVASRLPATPLVAEMEAKMQATSERLSKDPVLLAHRNVAATYELITLATDARIRYCTAVEGLPRAKPEVIAGLIEAERARNAAGSAAED